MEQKSNIQKRLLGTHVSVQGGLYTAFGRADELACSAVQIFTRNQRQWNTKDLAPDEITLFRNAWQNSSVKVVVSHASYLINLASVNDTRDKSERLLESELQRCSALGIDRIVLHPGFAGEQDKNSAVKMIAESLDAVLKSTEPDTTILLETMAGQGTVIGGCFDEISEIISASQKSNRLGVCVDTCHSYASGYDMHNMEKYAETMYEAETTFGLELVKCIHFNDSKCPLGSKKDRHENIGDGEVGLDTFSFFLNDNNFRAIPFILETPKEDDGDVRNLTLLRSLIKD